MDKAEAGEILAGVIADLRTRDYADLRNMLDDPRCERTAGESGTEYQVEVQVCWDGKANGDLRVLASIDDGGLSAFNPLSDDFIIASDGSFVGE